jgi:FkbM family methyltransferase
MARFSLLKLVLALLLVVLCGAKNDKNGLDYFQEGIRLLNEDKLDEAAMNFWGSFVSFSPDYPYTTNEAMDNFYLCYQKQDKVGLGYGFIAAQMYKRKDGRARQYLQAAYKADPTNADILQLMLHMGETEESIVSDRNYSPEDEMTGAESAQPTKTTKPHACRTREDCQRFIDKPDHRTLEPGWEDKVQHDYVNAQSRLLSTPGISVTIPPLGQFEVKFDTFWKTIVKDGQVNWEPETFQILHKYVKEETVFVDIGAWMGPTSFFSAQLAKKVFALEPDPVAYCTFENNIKLNPELNVVVHAIAVVTPQDAGYVNFETGKMGNSESMIVPDVKGEKEHSFEAAGFTLPFLFNLWGITFTEQPVFIKIDIEAYECKLIPSFHEWLVEEDSLQNLTIFVSFHPQLKPCSKSQMKGALETFKLFGRVSCNDHEKPLPVKAESTFEEFEAMLDSAGCLTDKETSDFVLTAA